MTDTLAVLLDDTIAGTVTRVARGALRFEYADEYRQQADPTPLSLSMPTQVRSHPDHVISPWLWGLLPDNNAVLARWGRQFQVSASSPFSLLATPIGEDCAGAVRFAPPDDVDRVLTRGGDITWLTEDEVATRLRDLKEDSTAWLGRSFTGQFSLAGAQAKAALLLRRRRWGVPHGVTPTTHILKPAVSGFDDHDLNEHLCLDAARRVGLLAVRTQVGRFADETAIVVDRYDRVDKAGDLVRVHQEDLCQALGLPPSRKYQNEGGPGPAQIAELLRQVMAPRDADLAVSRFADELIWNWLIGGTDAHAKNYSLLLAGKQVRLAPMYDVASALPYGMHEKKLRLAMKIGGDDRVFPERSTWPGAAKELGLREEAVVSRVRELAAAAPQAFADAASAPDITELGRPLPGKLVDLIADRAERCLRLVRSPAQAV
jgi:serine/threonine-protein kinase HipA